VARHGREPINRQDQSAATKTKEKPTARLGFTIVSSLGVDRSDASYWYRTLYAFSRTVSKKSDFDVGTVQVLS
jgi:hypothetical protein